MLCTFSPRRLMIAASLASGIAAGNVAAQVRVGAFDEGRGGPMSLASGASVTIVRANLRGACAAQPIFSSTGTLTPEFLGSVDALIVSSVRTYQSSIAPLSASEQAALVLFVQGGGGLIIFVDNLNFGGHDPTTPNGSLLAPFGFGIDDITAWPDPVTSTGQSPVTIGVPHFNVLLGGKLDVVPSSAQVLARLDSDQTPMLCAIPRGAISPGSGPVVVFADISLITDLFVLPEQGGALLNNALAFVSPEPSPCYANCDGSPCAPILTANDFQCFLDKFVAGASYANCDGVGGLTANDFQCFLAEFVLGHSYANCDGIGGLTANDFQCFLNAFVAGCS